MQTIDLHEAVLMYTHTKIELARLIREGINYSEILQYEKKLDEIDRILKREEKRLAKLVATQSNNRFEH